MDDFTVHCTLCAKAIEPGDGWLSVPYPAIRAVIQHPDDGHTIHWQAFHHTCDPALDGDYWIDVERLRTWDDLGHWTRHLQEKAWHQHTNWDQLLVALIAGDQTGILRPARARQEAI